MCLLVFKPAHADIAELLTDADEITQSNSDGFGAAWCDNGKVKTKRGFHGPDRQREIIAALHNVDAVLHWRFGTSGARSVDNCHPFKLRDGSAFAHNGIIPDKRLILRRKQSDTAALAAICRHADDFLAVVNEIDIGGSKFALIRPDGSSEIVGEERGDWINGVWYSNRNYKADRFGFGFGKFCAAWSDEDDHDFPMIEPVGDYGSTFAHDDDLHFGIEELVERFGYRTVCEALEIYPYAKGEYR